MTDKPFKPAGVNPALVTKGGDEFSQTAQG